MSDENTPNVFNTIEEALTAIRQGEMIMVVDDDDRENEGDLIMAASKATPEAVAFMIRHTSGILCTPILQEQAVKLHLDPMVSRNDAPMSTAFTVSIDYKEGLTTGISAEERAATTQALTNSNVTADDFVRPGHIFPLVARQGGVLVRSHGFFPRTQSENHHHCGFDCLPSAARAIGTAQLRICYRHGHW
jgi:3,4-dihydroxy 2-butanone 4-phosphate synthase/GTP cyclohydrolase II